ncbi:hypothetical protein L218DRAFT_649169 [Marasmius fiardii PR-910]|nr:hypothetical protein L218DRAFT_649169 [Marasmius fiardii PR-910]
MTAEGVSQPRRVIRPKYEFDPDAAYEDPQVQAWATYYAQGGADPAGSVHFIFVPGVSTRDGRQTNDEAHSSGMLQRHPSPSLTTDTNLPGQSLVSPRDSKPKSRMLGLSELLLQFSERKQAEKRLNFAPPSVVTPRSRDYDRELDSVRLRLKARVGSRLTKIFTFKNNSHTASIASPVKQLHSARRGCGGLRNGRRR